MFLIIYKILITEFRVFFPSFFVLLLLAICHFYSCIYHPIFSHGTLFTQVNAKRVAERKYQDTLHRAGFDSEYIASQGRNATDADMDALSDEDSYSVHHGDSARSSARSSYRTSTSPHSCSRRYSDDDDNEEEEEEVSSHTSEDSDLE